MNDTPPVLLPYQRRWVSDRSHVKVCEKSRRVGITWATAGESVIEAATQRGIDVWYIGYNEDQGLEFIRDCADWTTKLGVAIQGAGIEQILVEDEKGSIRAFRINFASGKRITALTSRPRNLRGKQGYIILDEAAFHDDLDGLLKAAVAAIMWGGRVAVISTHFGVDNAFAQIITESIEGKKKYSVHRVTLDEALADGLYKRICLVSGTDWTPEGEADWRKDLMDLYGSGAEEELLCIPSSGGGAYFPRAAIDACATVPADRVVQLINKGGLLDVPATRTAIVKGWCEGELMPVLRQIPKNEPCFLGQDFARTSDLSVLAIVRRTDSKRRSVDAVIEMRNVPHEAQLQVCLFAAHHIHLGGGAFDAGGNGSYLAEAVHEKYQSVEQVQISTQWYVDAMPPLRAALENRQLAIPRDEDSLDDLSQVRLHGGIPKLNPGRRATATGARHGDFAIALAMGFTASLDTMAETYVRAMSNM